MDLDLPLAIDIIGWHTINSAVVAIERRSLQHSFIANHWLYLSVRAKLNKNHQHKYNRYFIAEQIFVILSTNVAQYSASGQAQNPNT